jgi:endoglycosylceramidase
MTRRRVLGLGVTAGAFFAFGMSPLVAAPAAHADEFDVIVDPIINALSGIDPTLGADLGALAASFDPTFATDSAAAAAAPDVAAATPNFSELFNQYVYTPTHTALEDWINSSIGQQVDGFINSVTDSYAIGNGAPGTEADPDGGAAGWLFGDGGAGWNNTEAGVAGGTGGDAGLIGDGGMGGDGGPGADGGDGGTGGSFLGDGGDGGSAGAGAGPDGLPALGGAGGDVGALGIHGTVGDYGTATDDSSGSAGPLSAIGTTGSSFTNSAGQVVEMHGSNLVVKVSPYEPAAEGFNSADAQFLEQNGFNVVRVGIDWAALEPEPGDFNTAYLQSIESTVQTLGQANIYSIIDIHQDAYSNAFGGEGAPAWATESGDASNVSLPFPLNEFFDPAETQAWDSFWSNADAPNGIGLEDNYAQMVEYLANAFNGNNDVAGFEVMNEPSAGSQTLSTLFGSSFFDSQELTPFYNQAADAIRAVDPSTPIFVEPDVISGSVGLPISLGTVDASGVALSFHDYLPGTLAELPITSAETYAQANDIPLFMTEFGATNNQTDLADTMDDANQNLISWTEWAFTGENDITTTASPSSIESLVYNLSDAPTGANVNTANLDTLAEPYPQVISGTPTSFSFDNGTFDFSYSTAEADGLGSFAAGSQTTIAVPAVEFPNGYEVSVVGGHVVSAPDASELVIASNAGASTVSVVVTATADGGAGTG